MPLDVSFKNFLEISSGKYNAGQVDFVQGRRGAKLVKVNNHVFNTDSNKVSIDRDRVIQVKQAFLDSILTKVTTETRQEIAERLGMGDIDMSSPGASIESAMQKRFAPLQRQQLREIIAKYNLADGVTFKADSQKIIDKREAVNRELSAQTSAMDYDLNDMLDILALNTSLDKVLNKMMQRAGITANTEGYARGDLLNKFAQEIATLFKAAVALKSDNVPDTANLTLFGKELQVTCNRENQTFSVKINEGFCSYAVNFKASMQTIAEALQTEIVQNKQGAFTSNTGALLDVFYAKDIMNGLLASDRSSETRQFAAKIIAAKMQGNPAADVMKANINTNFLIMLAKEVLDGKMPDLNLDALNERHIALKRELGGMDEETQALLALVANVPLELKENKKIQMTVSSDMLNKEGPQEGIQKPATGDINAIANRVIPDSLVKHLQSADTTSKPADIRNFIADLMFSSDTLMAEVKLDMPGEHFRQFLMNERNMDAFRAIMLDRSVLDTAVSPTLINDAKACFDTMARFINEAYQKEYGVSLADVDKNSPDFKLNFAKLMNSVDANILATCDNLLLQFANTGTKSIQSFINAVFKLDDGDAAQKTGANAAPNGNPPVQGAEQPSNANNIIQINSPNDDSITNPYAGKSPAEIKQMLQGKSLNDLLDNSSQDTVPGQIGLFKVGLKSYFESMTINDKRSMLAASLRHAPDFDFKDVPEKDLDSVKKDKITKFCGAILKGTGPILQKMMQGLPRTMMGEFADALEDMKSKLPPINRKIVQAHFAQIIQNNPNIESISLKKSLGAATVGEALLCEVKYREEGSSEVKTKDVVIKIMRHDAVERTRREAKIFTEAAKKLGGGMEMTWKGQYEKIMDELDFKNEAANIEKGNIYNERVKGQENERHPVYQMSYNPKAAVLFKGIQATQNVLAMEVVRGDTADYEIKDMRKVMAEQFGKLFECDPATGKLLWQDGKPIPRKGLLLPDFLKGYSELTTMMQAMRNSQCMIMATAMTWFQEAILGSGIYHGDMHAGNLMLEDHKRPVMIDFGNITELKQREDGVDERKCVLKMVVGAMLRSPTIFLDGFQPLLSQNGKAEYAKYKAEVGAIMGEVMKKGQFSYDMCYRLQAAVGELQKLGLEMPPQINGFIQSMTRLQNTLAETNTLVSQALQIFDYMLGTDLPEEVKTQKEHELDFIGEAIQLYFSKEGQKVLVDSHEAYEYKTVASEQIDFITGMDIDKEAEMENKIATFLAGKQTVDDLKQAAHEMFDKCLLRHLSQPPADGTRTHISEKRMDIVENLNAIDELLNQPNLDLAQARETIAEKFKSGIQAIALTMQTAFTARGMFDRSAPGTFANVLANLVFEDADTANQVMDQFDVLQKVKVTTAIAGLRSELGFGFANMVNSFVDAVQEDLQKGPGKNSYQVNK